jgi:flagellar hook-associated protein 2
VTDSNGARLSLVANASGSAADFSVSQASGLGFTQAQAGANASLTVDGVPISSASNTVSGAVSGVTLNLQSASPGTTVNLSLAPDTSDITSTVQSFISAYNTLIGNLNTDVAYNQSTSAAGPLQSDSAAQSFYSDLLSAVNFSGGSGSVTSLNDLGITANNDGTLSLNTTTLQNAIQTNPTGVATFFQGATGSGGTGGFASSLTSTLSTYTDPSVGAFSVDLQSIAAENQDLTDQTNTLELYISSQQTILTQEYNNADIAIQQLPQQIQNTDALLGLTQNKNS